jgi:hypothetical protein
VLVEVSDDGGGIDVARIRQAALERNLVDEAILAGMSDDEAIAMIFEPGLSTASEVTGLSGRESGWTRCARPWSGWRVKSASRARGRGHDSALHASLQRHDDSRDWSSTPGSRRSAFRSTPS